MTARVQDSKTREKYAEGASRPEAAPLEVLAVSTADDVKELRFQALASQIPDICELMIRAADAMERLEKVEAELADAKFDLSLHRHEIWELGADLRGAVQERDAALARVAALEALAICVNCGCCLMQHEGHAQKSGADVPRHCSRHYDCHAFAGGTAALGAALAKARREGAEAMREAAADVPVEMPGDCRGYESVFDSGVEAKEAAVRALPIPGDPS